MALHVMDEANQCLGCKKPRCQQGCPIQTNIPEVIRLLKANKLDEAGSKAGIVRCCLFFSCVSPNADGFSGVLSRRFLEFANHFLFSQFPRHVSGKVILCHVRVFSV